MPTPIAKNHNSIIQKYQTTGKTTMMNKQRTVWGKHRSGYLIPFQLLIKPIKNFYSEKTEVYASIRTEVSNKEIVCVVVDTQMMITEVSASIVSVVPSLSVESLKRKSVHIDQVFPECTIWIKNRERAAKEITFNRKFQLDGEVMEEAVVYTVYINDISMTGFGVVGYEIKMIHNLVPKNANSYESANNAIVYQLENGFFAKIGPMFSFHVLLEKYQT